MKYCSKCGNEISDEAIVCIHCGCQVEEIRTRKKDEISVGLCVLSAIIPLFGIIYWAVTFKETPKRAKACGVTAIVAWGASFVISFFANTVYMLYIKAIIASIINSMH